VSDGWWLYRDLFLNVKYQVFRSNLLAGRRMPAAMSLNPLYTIHPHHLVLQETNHEAIRIISKYTLQCLHVARQLNIENTKYPTVNKTHF